MTGPRIALTTYSVKPRGGVVHTLELAETLHARGVDVTVIAMGDPATGFYREVDVPVRIVAAPEAGETLEERVFSWIEAMAQGLDLMRSDFDIVHSQDCISARAAARIRDAGADFKVIRTVHHVDDFHTQALMDCQRLAIEQPDQLLVVSELWKRQLATVYGVDATVVTNGVRSERFSTQIRSGRRAALRDSVGAGDRFLFLTVGGIEPRKGSQYLIEALGKLKAMQAPAPGPVLAVVGGHSFQDYRQYREQALGSLPSLDLAMDEDIILLGTLTDSELPEWFAAADAFVFPSVNEGFGLVVLEAMSAGLPVVTSDIEVFHEFLIDGQTAVMTRVGDVDSLAAGMLRVQAEPPLRDQLSRAGRELAQSFSWETTADQHLRIYEFR